MGFLRLLSGTAIFCTTLRMTSVHDFETRWGWLMAASWSVSAVNDVTIAATLVTILLCQRTYAQKKFFSPNLILSPDSSRYVAQDLGAYG